MNADARMLRSSREHATSHRLQEKAQADLERMQKVADDIRRMTKLYQERLEGRRGK